MLDCRELSTLFSETTNKNGRRKFLLLSNDFYVKGYRCTKLRIIIGTFNEAEIQRVNKSRDDLFKIEKILKRRRRRGKVKSGA